MIDCFSIPDLLAKRASQTSFHVASERHVRIEFRNMDQGDRVERFAYGGDVVVTCFKGEFVVGTAAGDTKLSELAFAVIPADTWTTIECVGRGTIQVIWAPAHAETQKDAPAPAGP